MTTSASRRLICFSLCWRLIHCLWYICVLHAFPLSSHLCVSRTHFISLTFSTHSNYTSPLLSRVPPRSLLHSRSSFIVCFLHIFYLCFRTWRSAFPSSFLRFIKKKVQWVTGDSTCCDLLSAFKMEHFHLIRHAHSSTRPASLPLRSASSRKRVSHNRFTKKSICSGICCAEANAGASYLRTLVLETHSTHFCLFSVPLWAPMKHSVEPVIATRPWMLHGHDPSLTSQPRNGCSWFCL